MPSIPDRGTEDRLALHALRGRTVTPSAPPEVHAAHTATGRPSGAPTEPRVDERVVDLREPPGRDSAGREAADREAAGREAAGREAADREPSGTDRSRAAALDERVRLLRLLATGCKDETAARQLGISVRTLRRRVAGLMAEFGVGTRLQLGAEAVRRHLL